VDGYANVRLCCATLLALRQELVVAVPAAKDADFPDSHCDADQTRWEKYGRSRLGRSSGALFAASDALPLAALHLSAFKTEPCIAS
jgi:hypothetical protein